jgi:cell division protein ZapA
MKAVAAAPKAGEGGMSQVNVTINGRQFRMACEDGQETHLMNLAQQLDQRIEGLRAKFGEIGDTRLTVMAAITIADELSEMGQRLKQLEEELATTQGANAAVADRSKSTQVAVAAALTSAAERIESVTKKLNRTIGGSSVALG